MWTDCSIVFSVNAHMEMHFIIAGNFVHKNRGLVLSENTVYVLKMLSIHNGLKTFIGDGFC